MKKEMQKKTTEVDMLHGPLSKKLLLFTLPIALSSILQQLFNAADTSIVGYFGNANALAAVGTNGEIVALIVTLSSVLTIGANILVANQIGQNKRDNISEIVQTSVVLAVLAGIIGLIIGQCVAFPLLRMIRTPQEILAAAESYLRIYLAGYPFLLLYDFGAAILRARGDSRYPFIALTVSGIMNVVLNLILVVVFHLGVAGVAIATDISTGISAWIVLKRLRRDELFQLSFRHLHIEWKYIVEILKMGIPSAIQGAVFCFANIFVQASVNTFGSVAIAGSTIAMNFEYFAYYGITAFGQTATTFASQNYAAGQTGRCRKILWQCLGFSVLCSLIMIEPVIIFRNGFSGLFSADKAVIESAGIRIMCILFFEPVCSFYEILAGVLRGTGHAMLPAVSTMVGTCLFRIVWICTVFRTHPSLAMLYHAFPLSWGLTIMFVGISFVVAKSFEVNKIPDKNRDI